MQDILKKCLDILIEEIFSHKDFENSQSEIQGIESIEELKCPQEDGSDFPSVKILDKSNRKNVNGLWDQARFKRTRHRKISIFILKPKLLRASEKKYQS